MAVNSNQVTVNVTQSNLLYTALQALYTALVNSNPPAQVLSSYVNDLLSYLPTISSGISSIPANVADDLGAIYSASDAVASSVYSQVAGIYSSFFSKPAQINPVIDSSLNTVTQGQTLSIAGSGFTLNGGVTLTMKNNGTTTQIWSLTASVNGGNGTGGFAQNGISPTFTSGTSTDSFVAVDNDTGAVSTAANVTAVGSSSGPLPAQPFIAVFSNGAQVSAPYLSSYARLLVYDNIAYSMGTVSDAWAVTNQALVPIYPESGTGAVAQTAWLNSYPQLQYDISGDAASQIIGFIVL